MRILHLSDTHLDRTDSPNADGVNARQSLRQMLGDLEAVRDIDVVVISGDISGDRSVEAYHAARELIGKFARSRNIPMVYSTGNEDERVAFSEVLGSGHLDATGHDRADGVVSSSGNEIAAVSQAGGYRFVTLDSLVPGKAYGWIGKTKLEWLREVLSEASPRGTVLAFHHPPIALDVEIQQALCLQNPFDLAEAIRDTDVQLILCGHFHLQLFGHLESVAVSVTPGVVGRVDVTAPVGTERAVRGASATMVHLGTPHHRFYTSFTLVIRRSARSCTSSTRMKSGLRSRSSATDTSRRFGSIRTLAS
jgi:3',5'-cyclic-AMP phosphodiesterase